MSTFKSMVTGAAVGVAAMAMWGMMNRSAQRKMGQMASDSARKAADKVGEFFGR